MLRYTTLLVIQRRIYKKRLNIYELTKATCSDIKINNSSKLSCALFISPYSSTIYLCFCACISACMHHIHVGRCIHVCAHACMDVRMNKYMFDSAYICAHTSIFPYVALCFSLYLKLFTHLYVRDSVHIYLFIRIHVSPLCYFIRVCLLSHSNGNAIIIV